jgi:hypothetical protein
MIIEDYVKNILEKDELAGDILRVLSLFNNVLWESEIRWEVEGMNSTLGREIDLRELTKKLEILSEDGILTLDRRIKGTMSGETKEEYLVKLLYPRIVSSVLKGDEKYRRYIEARREAYKKFMEKD